jgi:hypothetical protein
MTFRTRFNRSAKLLQDFKRARYLTALQPLPAGSRICWLANTSRADSHLRVMTEFPARVVPKEEQARRYLICVPSAKADEYPKTSWRANVDWFL